MVDVAHQSFHRPVPAPWILVHGAETETTEISPSSLAYRQRVGVGPRVGRSLHCCRWLARLMLRNDRGRFCRGQTRQVEGKLTGQQLVKNDSKGINVGADSDTIATNLLRRCVGGRTLPTHH